MIEKKIVHKGREAQNKIFAKTIERSTLRKDLAKEIENQLGKISNPKPLEKYYVGSLSMV